MKHDLERVWWHLLVHVTAIKPPINGEKTAIEANALAAR